MTEQDITGKTASDMIEQYLLIAANHDANVLLILLMLGSTATQCTDTHQSRKVEKNTSTNDNLKEKQIYNNASIRKNYNVTKRPMRPVSRNYRFYLLEKYNIFSGC